MLYDPKWEQSVNQKAKAFSLKDLVRWLEGQKPTEQYCFLDNGDCLLAKYFKHCGYAQPWVGETSMCLEGFDGERTDLPFEFRAIARSKGRTFGDALNTARKFVSGVDH